MKEKNGEHPFGDAGQLIFLAFFLLVWVGDSFFLRKSTFLADNVPLYIRLVILILSLITSAFLFMSGHVVVSHEQAPLISRVHLVLLGPGGFHCFTSLPLAAGDYIHFLQLHRRL
jgi:hypothetical protein